MRKRSSSINILAMQKSPRVLGTLLIASTALTAICSCEEENAKVKIVSSVEDCVKETSKTKAECEAAYKRAVAEAEKTGPKFESQMSCVEQFGPSQCRQSDSGVWMPLMAGFMVGNMMGNNGSSHHHYYHPNPVYTSRTGNYVSSSGTTLGKPGQSNYTVSSSAVKPQVRSTVSSTKATSYTAPKPKVTQTVDRGGFGSKGSAKSTWGSSSRSWGS